MSNLKLSKNSHVWLCPDNSGIAFYNGYDGNTIFLRSELENPTDNTSTSLQDEFSSPRLSALLGLSEVESTKMLNQLINWGILVGSDD